MEKNDCGACGTPKKTNHFGKLDCHKCYPENFFGFATVEPAVKVENPDDAVDIPVFEDQRLEVLEELEESDRE